MVKKPEAQQTLQNFKSHLMKPKLNFILFGSNIAGIHTIKSSQQAKQHIAQD